MDAKIIRDLIGLMKQESTKPTSYDTTAKVNRIEGNTAWVHIPGGVDETPVELSVDAKAGDTVRVRVSGGQAWLTGNNTAPPTDDTKANAAKTVADRAMVRADNAQISAGTAADAARNAQGSAVIAATAANNALTQLSVVEDVVGVLTWISEHGTYVATQDTAIVPGKMYFIRSGSGTSADPYVFDIVISPADDPAAAGYYELDSIDEAVTNYVSSHLALTDAGLWVVKDNQGGKILIHNSGVKLYDASGTEVASFGTNVILGETGDNNKLYAQVTPTDFYLRTANRIAFGVGNINSGGSLGVNSTDVTLAGYTALRVIYDITANAAMVVAADEITFNNVVEGSASANPGPAVKTSTAYASTGNVSAGNAGGVNITIPSLDDYTCVGVMAIQSSQATTFMIGGWYFNSATTMRIGYKNTGSATANCTFTATFLFVRDSLLPHT